MGPASFTGYATRQQLEYGTVEVGRGEVDRGPPIGRINILIALPTSLAFSFASVTTISSAGRFRIVFVKTLRFQHRSGRNYYLINLFHKLPPWCVLMSALRSSRPRRGCSLAHVRSFLLGQREYLILQYGRLQVHRLDLIVKKFYLLFEKALANSL